MNISPEKVRELELRLLPFEQWRSAPDHVYSLAMTEHAQGVPTGVVHDVDLGWCILQSGQGPYVLYSESRDSVSLG